MTNQAIPSRQLNSEVLTLPRRGKILSASLAITTLLGASALAVPQASLTLKGSDVALCNHNNTAWDLTKTAVGPTGTPGDQTVTWTVTATKGLTSPTMLQVSGFVAVQNTGTAPATIGNIVVNLQRQKNIGTVAKPKWAWASVSADVADATSGDAATSAHIVAAASQEVPANSGGVYAIAGAMGTFAENAGCGSLSFTDQNSNTVWAITPQKVLAPLETVNLLFTANFNNSVLAIPAGESVRAEVIVSFGGVGTRGGSGSSAANIDVNGNGQVDTDEVGVRSVPTRITRTVPAVEACNSEVTLTDTGVFTAGTVTSADPVSDGAPSDPISETTSFTVTATGVNGGSGGGTIGNTATLTGESDSVSVIVGYQSVTDPVTFIVTQVPIYYDFACCVGVNLSASDVVEILGDSPDFNGFPENAFFTYTIGGYGAPGEGTPDLLMLNSFTTAFSSGLTIGINDGVGSQHHAAWSGDSTGLAAIRAYLTGGGGSGALTADTSNATSVSGGALAKQTTALTLNIGFEAYSGGSDPASFGDLVFFNLVAGSQIGDFILSADQAAALNGVSVQQVLTAANNALGGNGLPAYVGSFGNLNQLVTKLNESFDNGVPQGIALSFLCPP